MAQLCEKILVGWMRNASLCSPASDPLPPFALLEPLWWGFAVVPDAGLPCLIAESSRKTTQLCRSNEAKQERRAVWGGCPWLYAFPAHPRTRYVPPCLFSRIRPAKRPVPLRKRAPFVVPGLSFRYSSQPAMQHPTQQASTHAHRMLVQPSRSIYLLPSMRRLALLPVPL